MSTKSRRKNRPLAVTFIYYYGKIVGLCPLTLDHENELQFSYYCIVYAVGISITYTLIFFWAMEMKYTTSLPGQTIAAVVVDGNVHFLQLLTMIFSWLIFAFRQKKLRIIIKNIQKTVEIINKLGLSDNKQEIFQSLLFRAFLLTIYFVVVLITDQTFYSQLETYKPLIWISYRSAHIVIHYVFLLFIMALDIVQTRFSQLNTALRKLTINSCREEISIGENSEHSVFFIRLHRFSISMSKNIEIVGELHEDLKQLVEDVTDFFAWPILIALYVNLINIVSTANILYLIIRFFTNWKWPVIMMATMSFLSFFANIMECFLIAIVSGSVLDEANSTGNILHKIRINSDPNHVYSIIQASLQLLQNKLKISPCGLIDLNYEFMYKVCSSAITYIIIVVQFDGPKSKSIL